MRPNTVVVEIAPPCAAPAAAHCAAAPGFRRAGSTMSADPAHLGEQP